MKLWIENETCLCDDKVLHLVAHLMSVESDYMAEKASDGCRFLFEKFSIVLELLPATADRPAGEIHLVASNIKRRKH